MTAPRRHPPICHARLHRRGLRGLAGPHVHCPEAPGLQWAVVVPEVLELLVADDLKAQAVEDGVDVGPAREHQMVREVEPAGGVAHRDVRRVPSGDPDAAARPHDAGQGPVEAHGPRHVREDVHGADDVVALGREVLQSLLDDLQALGHCGVDLVLSGFDPQGVELWGLLLQRLMHTRRDTRMRRRRPAVPHLEEMQHRLGGEGMLMKRSFPRGPRGQGVLLRCPRAASTQAAPQTQTPNTTQTQIQTQTIADVYKIEHAPHPPHSTHTHDGNRKREQSKKAVKENSSGAAGQP